MSLSVFLFFAVLFVLVFAMRAARVGTLVAFLFAGILSGPHIMNLFQLTDTWHFLGNLGIIFLWFNIGLQINLKRLWQMKRTIFGLGSAQVLMVAIMLFPILSVLTHWSIMGAVMVALLLAMSSTSADLQLLADRDELNTTPGRQAFSILLFQDLLSIPLLAMLPVFAGRTFNLGATVIDITVLSLGLILGVAVVSRVILNPLLRLVSKLKSKEVFLITVMLIIAGGAVALDALGLPAGLGAFLAGMLMSETIYNHQVGVEITPYSTLFLALFFIALGMELNLPFLMERWYWVLIGLAGLIAVKFTAIYIVARVRGVESYDASRVALILAQGGEFGLLMMQTMRQGGISAIPAAHEEILVAIIILSIIATPLLMAIYDWVMRRGKFVSSRARCLVDVSPDAVPAVFICGFGRVGQIVARMLEAQGIPYIALDLNVHSVMLGRERGCNVAYGDTRNPDVLKCFGMSARRTRAVVVALDNATTARDTISNIKTIAPRVKIFARARNLADSKMLIKQGVTSALPETIESSFSLAYGVLEHLGISDARIDGLLAEMRANNYEKLVNVSDDRE